MSAEYITPTDDCGAEESHKALYDGLLEELKNSADGKYAEFHSRLLGKGDFAVLGVRVPALRRIAKKYYPFIGDVLTFPDDFYEIKFIKLACAAMLPYERFLSVVDYCVTLIDNWALCDLFSPKCVAAKKEEFLPYVKKYLKGGEFEQRFALTTLLSFYVKEEYLPLIEECLVKADKSQYYVHMAAAWLIAEVLIKFYDFGVGILTEGNIGKKTHNTAIRKACESYRISPEKKNYLKGIKK